jgi:hypothetical protein
MQVISHNFTFRFESLPCGHLLSKSFKFMSYLTIRRCGVSTRKGLPNPQQENNSFEIRFYKMKHDEALSILYFS